MLDQVDSGWLEKVARDAGRAILEVYGTEFSVDVKEDKSPLTEADRRSNAVIVSALEEAWPDVPILSEETRQAPFEERKDWEWFWLVDPMDGTKEFIKRNGEFTVNIALIHQGKPVAGVVYQPEPDRLYTAVMGRGAFLKEAGGVEPVRLQATEPYTEKDFITVVASRSHLSPEVETFVEDLRAQGKMVEFQSAGSSLKICRVADGSADVYPRFGPTMEWDTGAAHAIAAEAGRTVTNHDTGEPLRYNKPDLLNPWFIVA